MTGQIGKTNQVRDKKGQFPVQVLAPVRHMEGGGPMEKTYLITGVNGFLGRNLAKKLIEKGGRVIGLRLSGDTENLQDDVIYRIGDITRKGTLERFFSSADGEEAMVIHCAGMVTVASEEKKIWKVNVDGTRNIADLCMKYRINRMVYVSSVHAIPEQEIGRTIHEGREFSASCVEGVYGKSKAEATAYVRKAIEYGLHAVVVHPSGMLGPGDYGRGYMTEMVRAYLKGYLPVAVSGGFDFVDVRDVADGIISCLQKGREGEGYILSNEYISVKRMLDTLAEITGRRKVPACVPLSVVRAAAPVCERICRLTRIPQLVTPYSVHTLGSNGHYSHEKATAELGYAVRPLKETLEDTVSWMGRNRRIGS